MGGKWKMDKRKRVPIIGAQFGNWTVISTEEIGPVNDYKERRWLCRCKCGKEFWSLYTLLFSGHSKGCRGCGNEKFKKMATKHHGYKTKLHGIWEGVKSRCCNKNDLAFPWYGGRGITLCEEWLNDFGKFQAWAENNGYEEHLEIDRKDTNSNYSPQNCRFVTHQQNMFNRRGNSKSKSGYKGVSTCREKWKSIITINQKTIHIGVFMTKEEAALAYNEAAKKYFGEYAHLNVIKEPI